MKKLLLTIIAIVLVLGVNDFGSAAPLKSPVKSIPPGHARDAVYVRFFEDSARLGTPTDLLSKDLLKSVQSIKPLFNLGKARLDDLKERGRQRLRDLRAANMPLPFDEVPDLNLWFKIILKKGTDQLEFIQKLQWVDSVDVIELEPLPAPPPFIGATPNYTGDQGYLDSATDGIDADYSWTLPGGTGQGVKIYDLEYSWNQNHEDLDTAAGVALLTGGSTAADPFNDTNHGTAVLGEMIATDDTIGVTGISFGADIGLAPTNYTSGYNLANAIALSAADGKPGDVILIEQQTSVCSLGGCNSTTQLGCGPSEWNAAVFAAIQSAVASGITVVAAAGNGSVDLDQAACGNIFNRNVQDSGAIIVGAGRPPGPTDRERQGFSTYGSRVDVQGWGSSVMTTGYGWGMGNPNPPYFFDEADPANPDRWYTPAFAGTSSASPIVAGAAANLQGVAQATGSGQPLDPSEVRDILVATGSPQQGDTSEHIGPRPNLRRAIAEIIPIMQIPGSLYFGSVCCGDSLTKELNVCNTGEEDLEITSISSSDAQFSVTDPSGGFPVYISHDFCFPFEARFTPTGAGPQAAILTVQSNDPLHPAVEVEVFGNMTEPKIAVTGSTDFGNVCEETLAEKEVSVCNLGACDLEVTGAIIDCNDFMLINSPFPSKVSPDFCVPLVVRFTPTSAGPKTCNLVIASSDPDVPEVTVELTGNTPFSSIDVPPHQGFRPTVIQSVDVCESALPFPVSNTGLCDLEITDLSISGNEVEYSLAGLPSFPIILEAGDVAGSGDLNTVFAPQSIDRERGGTVSVTYVSDPVTGATVTVDRDLCGEGVRTGARVLVTSGGVPLNMVKSIKLQRLGSQKNKNRLDTIDNAKNLTLQTVTPAAPCGPFQYHREYGTVSNPIQLAPGSYVVTVQARIGGKNEQKTVGFDVSSCDFNPNIVVDF